MMDVHNIDTMDELKRSAPSPLYYIVNINFYSTNIIILRK